MHSALPLRLTVRMPIFRMSHSSLAILLLLTPVVLELDPFCKIAKYYMQQQIVAIPLPFPRKAVLIGSGCQARWATTAVTKAV